MLSLPVWTISRVVSCSGGVTDASCHIQHGEFKRFLRDADMMLEWGGVR